MAQVMAAIAIGVLGGCGGGDSTADDAPATQRIELSAAAAPSQELCGFGELRGPEAKGAPGNDPPAAGVYAYATAGKGLPQRTESTVTPSTKQGGITCFGSDHRYTKTTRTADVYLLRGEDIYIVADGFDTPHFVQSVKPRPAILALSGTQQEWRGTFAGATSGTYSVEIVGRRTFTIGGKRVKAVGLSSRATFRGETTGTQRRTTWLATGRALVVRETGSSVLHFGGDVERLSYSDRLLSLEPKAGGG
jgi:hypothetical protein